MSSSTKSLRYIVQNLSIICCRHNSNTAGLSRIKRQKYSRLYPTRVVNPDGSTYTVRYEIPRQIICLPIDYKNLSTEEQLKVLANRRPKEQKKEIKDNLDGDTFSAENYLNRFKS